MLPAPRVVLFDLDNTLFDHGGAVVQGLRAARARHAGLRRMPWPELLRRYDELLTETERPVLTGKLSLTVARERRFRRLIAETGAISTLEEARTLAKVYRERYQGSRQAMRGARALLASYRRDGIPVGIVTNNLVEEQEDKLAVIGLRSLVSFLVTSEEVGATKPSPEIFRTALRRGGVEPAETRMVGDSWNSDILGAAGLGIPAIWYNPRGAPIPAGPIVPVLESFAPAYRARSRIAAWEGSYEPGAPSRPAATEGIIQPTRASKSRRRAA
ncbi:MAG TPA: HAD family hydrolase [Thermoplasmata archaeon]|nr:HAD family hydrolase [Thermoplasmata archaeon]